MCGAKQSLNPLYKRPTPVLRNFNQPGCYGPVKFSISLIIITISSGYIKLFLIDNL